MPKLGGLFDQFNDLDTIHTEDVARWIKPVPNTIGLENYIGNKVLYPQAIPVSALDLQIDLALLREVIRRTPAFFNKTSRKIVIPENFTQSIPNITQLVWVFLDAFLLDHRKIDSSQDLWTVVLSGQADEVLGTIVLPEFEGEGIVRLNIEGKEFTVKEGDLSLIPCPKSHCLISFKINKGKMLGKKEDALEVYGGRLGLLVDGRKR